MNARRATTIAFDITNTANKTEDIDTSTATLEHVLDSNMFLPLTNTANKTADIDTSTATTDTRLPEKARGQRNPAFAVANTTRLQRYCHCQYASIATVTSTRTSANTTPPQLLVDNGIPGKGKEKGKGPYYAVNRRLMVWGDIIDTNTNAITGNTATATECS